MPGSQCGSMAESMGTDSLGGDGDNSSTISDSSTDTTATSIPPDLDSSVEAGMEQNMELFGVQLEVS